MLNHRNVNIFFIFFILGWLLFSQPHAIPVATCAWILLAYLSMLFFGSYFIRLNYFFKSLNKGDGQEKEIALSFDDGPGPSFTPAILDLLKERNCPAAFFCIGKNIAGNEDLLHRIVNEGHIIGNHSYSHHALFDLYGPARMLDDLNRMNAATQAVTGLRPRLFRPPYGVTNPNLGKAVRRGGFVSIGWSIRSLDTVIRGEDRLMHNVLTGLRPGSILLFHDTSETTVKILPELIRQIGQRGYRIVRLDKMLKLNPYA